MKNKLTPSWFPLPIYSSKLKPEEWMQEIYKRSLFKERIDSIPPKIRAHIFLDVFIENKYVQNIFDLWPSDKEKPIKPISMFEIVYLSTMIHEWIQNHSDANKLYKAVDALKNRVELSDENRQVISDFNDIPWFEGIVPSKNYAPFYKLAHMNGAPLTINADFYRDDIISEMRLLLNQWRGDKKRRSITKKTFEEWNRLQILAVFDLKTWFEINKISYRKTELANIIWENGYPISKKNLNQTTDPNELIKYAIEMANKYINMPTLRDLKCACDSIDQEPWRWELPVTPKS